MSRSKTERSTAAALLDLNKNPTAKEVLVPSTAMTNIQVVETSGRSWLSGTSVSSFHANIGAQDGVVESS